MKELIDTLKSVAKQRSWGDTMRSDGDCYPNDMAGGNIDDAYSGGDKNGRIDLAREILTKLGENW